MSRLALVFLVLFLWLVACMVGVSVSPPQGACPPSACGVSR